MAEESLPAETIFRLLFEGEREKVAGLLRESTQRYRNPGLLHVFSYFGEMELLKEALQNGADLNQRYSLDFKDAVTEQMGRHFGAAVEAFEKAVKASEGGKHLVGVPNVEVDPITQVQRYQSASPLFIAACEGQHEIVRFLLEKGANEQVADGWGRTPLTIASEKQHGSIVEILENYHSVVQKSQQLDELSRNRLNELVVKIKQGVKPSSKELTTSDRRNLLFYGISLEGQPLSYISDNDDKIFKCLYRSIGKLETFDNDILQEAVELLASKLHEGEDILSYSQHFLLDVVVAELFARFRGEAVPTRIRASLEKIVPAYEQAGRARYPMPGMLEIVENGQRLLDGQRYFNLRDSIGQSLSGLSSQMSEALIDAMSANKGSKLPTKLLTLIKNEGISDETIINTLDIVSEDYEPTKVSHHGNLVTSSWFDSRNRNVLHSLILLTSERKLSGTEAALARFCQRASEKIPECGPVDLAVAKSALLALEILGTDAAASELNSLVKSIKNATLKKKVKAIIASSAK